MATVCREIGRRRLGSTGLCVTEIGFGAATLGNLYRPIADVDAGEALSTAFEAGLTYVDTAPFYGFGLSELRVGDALRGRQDIVVSTKVGRLLVADEEVSDDGERHGFRSAMRFRPVFDYRYDATCSISMTSGGGRMDRTMQQPGRSSSMAAASGRLRNYATAGRSAGSAWA
jgi:hypothetical protein